MGDPDFEVKITEFTAILLILDLNPKLGALNKYTNWVVKLREDSRPRTLVLELTKACNYSCIHCFRFAARDFKVTFMDEELYHKIVKEAIDIGVRRIAYTGWASPRHTLGSWSSWRLPGSWV